MNRASSATGWARNPDGSPGWTFNPITGCLNNCSYCYARKLANTRLKEMYLWNDNIAQPNDKNLDQVNLIKALQDPFYPRFWEDRLEGWKTVGKYYKPKGIFVCDMSDLFGIGLPEEWTWKVLSYIKVWNMHRFYLLTKQPQNLIKFSPFPENCWVGVSATDAEMFYDACADLGKVKAAVRFISFEPLLDRINGGECEGKRLELLEVAGIKWIIIGSLTGSLNDIKKSAMQYPDLTLMPYGKKWTLQPKIEWVEEIVEACDKAGIPVFLKDNLEALWTFWNRREPFFKFSRSSPGATSIGKVRQEMPNA